MARANTVLLMQAADRLIAVIEAMDTEVHADAIEFAIGWLASNGPSGGVHTLTWTREEPLPVVLALLARSLDLIASEGLAHRDPAVRAEVVRLLDRVARDAQQAVRFGNPLL